MDRIHVLQLGETDWSRQYRIPDDVEWDYEEEFAESPEEAYDIAFLDRLPGHGEIGLLMKEIKAHTLYVTEEYARHQRVKNLFLSKVGKVIRKTEIQAFLDEEIRFYYAKPYGEKYKGKNLAVSPGFGGNVNWNGGYCVNLEGDFGEEYRQTLFWRNNVPVRKGQVIDLWLEYQITDSVDILLKVTQLVRGSISEKKREWVFTQEDLKELVSIDSPEGDSLLFVSIHAKGRGELRIVALHDRFSRGKHGSFLPGGERYVSTNREEVFCYFDPGDRKPPLNIYFSGYKTQEGFEGYYLMRKMGAPFLLISESRLEGGAFYMGTPEYEAMIVNMIRKHIDELGFQMSDVVMSGLSMGTYGALYYGCDIRPHAVIIGKPLASIGDVAANETYYRPGGFPTSMDVLLYHQGDTGTNDVQKLNRRFWEKFDRTNWSKSKFVVAYMIEDDYDMTAYQKLLSHLHDGGVQVYGKGLHGRHNDATGGIVQWFLHQYKKVLIEDFGRKLADEW